jgi:toxin ParE1/3/4
MTKVVVSPQAEADLRELAFRIADAAGERVAQDYLGRMIAVIQKLSRVPRAAGRLVPLLGVGLRCHPFGNYNIYLRHDEVGDVLYVVRILHGRRNITKTIFTP